MTSTGKKLLLSCALIAVLFLGALGAQPGCNDTDWDSVQDADDNCPSMYNPLQANEDGDAIGDACDDNTTMHEFQFAHCYRTNWSELTGPGFEDIPFTIYQPAQQFGSGRLRWPDFIHDTLEDGPLSHNGRDIWFMGQWIGVEYATATYIEGTQTEVDDNNVVTKIEGSYQMLECNNCDFNLIWSSLWQGAWVGELMPADFCDLQVDDDTMADDDTADDDTVDDDATDDDAADDDGADDDTNAPPTGDDDDNDSGCGC